MQFANPQEARDFLAQHPEVRLIELMLIDANGIPRGKLLHRDELLAIYENGRPLPSSILSLTIQGEDVEAIKNDTEELTKAFYAVSEKLYKATGAAPEGAAPGPDGGASAGGPQQGEDGEYYSNDFHVKDDGEDKK